MARKTQKAASKFENQVRFNWGFHDGIHAASGAVPVRSMKGHFDSVYAAGYEAGVRDYYRSKVRTENSEAAWVEYRN